MTFQRLSSSAFVRSIAAVLIGAQNLLLSTLSFFLFGPLRSFEPKSILVLRTAALGDFILSIPALAALRARFPSARITLLTAPTTNRVVAEQVNRYAGSSQAPQWLSLAIPTLLDEAFIWSGASRTRMLKDARAVVRQVAPDTVFVLSDIAAPVLTLVRKLIFLRLAGVRSPVFGWRMRTSISIRALGESFREQLEHHVMGPIRSVAHHPKMGPAEQIPVQFPVNISDSALAWAARLWDTQEWHEELVLAVAPGSIQPHKRWPIQHFVRLCEKLAASDNVKVVVLGTKDESALGEKILAALGPKALNLMGQTSIDQTAAVLKKCALAVGNDGGAMHLAAAVGCKAVSIIPGIEFPGSIEPWGSAEHAVRHPVPCAPCYDFKKCPKKHGRCMSELPIAKVLGSCEAAIAKIRTSRGM